VVVDTKTLQFIPALKAYYVVGSSKPATMSRISKYAFKSKADAEDFAKKYGGRVVGFYDAYDVAIKDFVK
jgi:nitrous oxide reductase accessory protein NosL